MGATTKAKTNGARPNRETRRAFVRPRHVTLKFTDGEFEGLEVRTRRPSLDELFGVAEKADGLEVDVSSMGPEEMAATRELLAIFAEFLVSWNLEVPVLDDDGEETDETIAVPATLEGLMSQDIAVTFTLFTRWFETVGDVAAPLGATSSDGGPSAVPSTLPPVVPLPSPEN